MSNRFSGKVVVVTGAGDGIGRACACAFAAEGAQVVVAEINPQTGQRTVAEIRQAGGCAEFIQTDVSVSAQVNAAVAFAVQQFGHLDVMVNNAGIEGLPGPIKDCTDENVQKTMLTNYGGCFSGIRAAVNQFLAQGSGGTVVNIASFLGMRGFAGMAHYAATKWAILGLTESAAAEYAPAGIRINAVLPGCVRTPMLVDRFCQQNEDAIAGLAAMAPTNRLVEPEEVAEYVLFLASDKVPSLVGAMAVIDGGILAK